MPEDEIIYVRPVVVYGVRLYKFFRKVAPRKYESIPEYDNYGFCSKARAEKKASQLMEK